MNNSAGLPTWVERLLIGMALFFGAIMLLLALAWLCTLLGIPLPTLDDGH